MGPGSGEVSGRLEDQSLGMGGPQGVALRLKASRHSREGEETNPREALTGQTRHNFHRSR